MQATAIVTIETRGQGFTDITRQAASWLEHIGAREGLLTVFVRHTSASLTIQENADPDVRADLADALDRLAPEDAGYRHSAEGADDMPAHIKAMMTATSIGIPVMEGRAVFGTWQGLYLIEHRRRPHARQVVLSFVGAIGA